MKTASIDLPDEARRFLQDSGFDELYPPQADSVSAGLLEGSNILVAAPTASGKTLIALMAILACISRGAGKAVYLSPLRALADEKYAEFKELEKITINGKKPRVVISTGDYETRRASFERADIIVLTNERMDSIIRRRPAWVDHVELVISDEVHIIGNDDRGPALEMALTNIKSMENKPQILALSATVSNAEDIAVWLDAELVSSTWRPVPLREGVYDGSTITMDDGSRRDLKKSVRGSAVDVGIECVNDGGKSLIFANTRPRSVSLATKASGIIKDMIKDADKKKLEAVAQKIIAENERTELVKKLADLVRQGVAFHHAGLSKSCRSIVESEFRTGAVHLIAATPTLAAGVNLPARRVVISSIARYDVQRGRMAPISVLEYKQMAGRAGRPQYDDYGETIIVTTTDPDEIAEHYIGAEAEPIESRITGRRAMLVHTLGLLVMRPSSTRDEIISFFMDTLAGTQMEDYDIEGAVDNAIEFLVDNELIMPVSKPKSSAYTPSKFGSLVSMLYLDPATAITFNRIIDLASSKRDHTLGLVYEITSCSEFYPKFMPRESDTEIAYDILSDHSEELLEQIYPDDLSRAPLAMHMWITESSETSISDKLGVESGDLHRMAERAAWLAYCLAQIARHRGRRSIVHEATELHTRITYGIRKELLELVRLRNVGRVRARRLYRAGFRDRDSLRTAPLSNIARVGSIGESVAKSIKSQVMRGKA